MNLSSVCLAEKSMCLLKFSKAHRQRPKVWRFAAEFHNNSDIFPLPPKQGKKPKNSHQRWISKIFTAIQIQWKEYIYTYICIYTYMYTHTHICIYTYIYKFIQTKKRKRKKIRKIMMGEIWTTVNLPSPMSNVEIIVCGWRELICEPHVTSHHSEIFFFPEWITDLWI